ncbi:STAS domain-containing protein [Pseudoxanthomonas dokdonensis]|uniref:STAS domain-containing protein n=1 Tax=Pseudoxanthomonas dokdonensis TaxID=344882 RepID=A0A0R0CPY0_9GAMM|nr:STAS domain-containing protein [Pseudoxanthomonas dokdonensis]KRG68482.1 hypothetical protein ABB29_12730 [Pseudoxanthomonas dokdonensis]
MASNTPAPATLARDGDALVFTGALDRQAATRLWAQLLDAAGGASVQRIVLSQVTTVDSAGLALLAELLARLRAAGVSPQLQGEPPGLAELRSAYRLTPELEFPA